MGTAEVAEEEAGEVMVSQSEDTRYDSSPSLATYYFFILGKLCNCSEPFPLGKPHIFIRAGACEVALQ